jgi:nucleoside-diphosphate-sugar epimerase
LLVAAAVNLVTGGTGFIGMHLAQRLVAERKKVRLLCRPGSETKLDPQLADTVEISYGDLCDRESLVHAVRGVSRIFHCAGHVSDWGDRDAFDLVNVRGTRWLLEAASVRGVQRFVHVSSIAAFGTPSPPYFDDDSPHGTSRDGYSRSKARGEQLALMFHRDRGVPVTVLRPAIVYGPQGTWLEEPLALIERGRMRLLAGGVGTCHPCYIDNLVDAMLLASEHPAAVGEAFIVSDGASITFRQYFDALAAIAGLPPVRRSIPRLLAFGIAGALELLAFVTGSAQRPRLTRTAVAMVATRSEMSIDKIRRMLDYQPRYSFDDAIQHLRAWYATRPRAGGSATAQRQARSRQSRPW